MKVLFLTSRFPHPPDRGDRLRTHGFLRAISRDHDVRLATFVEREPPADVAHVFPSVTIETVTLPALRSRLQLMGAIPSARPFQVAYYASAEMRRLVAARAPACDVVIAHLIRMAPYLNVVPRETTRIVDLCDCISSEYRDSLPHRGGIARAFYAEEAKRVARYERELLGRVDEAWAISSAEIDKFEGDTRVLRVVPNGVDLREGETAPPPRPTLVFTGNLSVPHNVDAATFLVNEILPRVRSEIPDACVRIAGSDVTKPVRALASDHVEIVGRVPDMNEFLRTGTVFVAPMRFVAGVQNKVLEAMAASLPVVMTPNTARGIGAEGEAAVADGAPAIAQEIVAILRDPTRAGALGRAGRDLVRERFSWNAVRKRLRAIEAERSPSASA